MASFHLSVKTVSRSSGRSATAAAAYRAGARIEDERTGEIHDYSRKGGVSLSQIVLPPEAPGWAGDRSKLWNAAESAEKRKNSVVAREFEVALPAELPDKWREALVLDFARELTEQHQVAADVAIHSPGRGGDQRNHHAHILLTTRRITPAGLAEKTRELDDRSTGKVGHWRERWATLQNERLRHFGRDERVDHRSLKEQGKDRPAQVHLGPTASAMERRGVETERGRLMREVSGRDRDSKIGRMTDRELVEATRKHARHPLEYADSHPWVQSLKQSAAKAKRSADLERVEVEKMRHDVDTWHKTHWIRSRMQKRVGIGGKRIAEKQEAVEERYSKAAGKAETARAKYEKAKATVQREQTARRTGPVARYQAMRAELQARQIERGMDRTIAQEVDRAAGRDHSEGRSLGIDPPGWER